MPLNQSDAIRLAKCSRAGTVLLKLSHYQARWPIEGLDGKWAAPTLGQLSNELMMNRKTVRRHMEALERKGLIRTHKKRFNGSPRLYYQISEAVLKGDKVLGSDATEADRRGPAIGLPGGQNGTVYKEQKKEQNKSETAQVCAASPETGQAPEKVACCGQKKISGKVEGKEQTIRPVQSRPFLGSPGLLRRVEAGRHAEKLGRRRQWGHWQKVNFAEWLSRYLHKCEYRKCHGFWPTGQ